ncbi:MAG: GvpL/GvpF family gas vesicle protein [Chloroflexi bacterium]|nr:GvpL/GvpF family gas vesicle protein [Chloroflexota bacterium]
MLSRSEASLQRERATSGRCFAAAQHDNPRTAAQEENPRAAAQEDNSRAAAQEENPRAAAQHDNPRTAAQEDNSRAAAQEDDPRTGAQEDDPRISGPVADPSDVVLACGPGVAGGGPVQVLVLGDLAAIVSAVPLVEFGAEAIRARLEDAAWLETMVRGHNRVVETIHRRQVVLPAKFGSVYASAADLAAALADVHDILLTQLRWLDGCDEWGVRLYADRETIQQRVVTENTAVRQLQHELASARPGRAYFLQRKLADLVAAETEQALSTLAQTAYDHADRIALAGQINPRSSAARRASQEVEILRAAFLIRRPDTAAFFEAIRHFAEDQAGLRCEYSGPWAPYSFAASMAGDLR